MSEQPEWEGREIAALTGHTYENVRALTGRYKKGISLYNARRYYEADLAWFVRRKLTSEEIKLLTQLSIRRPLIYKEIADGLKIEDFKLFTSWANKNMINLKKHGLVKQEGGHFSLTTKGALISNALSNTVVDPADPSSSAKPQL